jgi:hypothetical protein
MAEIRDKVRKSPHLAQLSLFGPLRHIEQALEREYALLSKTDKNKFGADLRCIRENVRDLDERLTAVQEKRKMRNAK